MIPSASTLTDFRVVLLIIIAGSAAAGGDTPANPAGHWAFEPPRPHAPPPVQRTDWPVNDIDRFILAKLESVKLSPSPPADRRTLIRRAHFDLLGLPPTFEQVQVFLDDSSADSYERLIDELLASPRYGERWGRYWLDLARYADTKGYVYGNREERFFVHAHAYRDWVIAALNADMPYDEFLTLQIAADHIPQGQPKSLAAMGFLTVGRRFLGVIPDIMDDRIDVLTRATQGLTVSCARCHDHKFDPIPTADYYSLYGVLTASSERLVPLQPDAPRTPQYLEFEKELHNREAKLSEQLRAKRIELTERLRMRVADYLAAVLDVEKLPTDEFYELRQPDELIPTVVRHWQAYLFRRSQSFDPVFQPWHELGRLGSDEFSGRATQALASLLGASGSPLNRHVAQALAAQSPGSMKDVAALYGTLLSETDKMWREAIAADPSLERLADEDREALRQVLYGEDSPTIVPEGHIHEISWYFDEPTRAELDRLYAEIERWLINAPAAPPYAVTLYDRPDVPNPRIFIRGNQAVKGPEVPRQYLQLIEGAERRPFTSGSGRLELAQAIASPDNPLTARVMANRVWHYHFGRGLVATPSDFGTRADPPSHPQLLDYLSLRFIEDGWSLKKLHKLIMLSATYRQASADRPDCARTDSENRLLWRFTPQRLDLEAMRDATLAASGELDLTMGGRPDNLFTEGGTPRRTIWGSVDPTPASLVQRRTVYGLVDRQFLPGVFRVFDFANPDLHAPLRPVTTVPQQSLFLMNSSFVAGRARALAGRSDVASLADSASRIERLYKIVYQRPPTPSQAAAAERFIEAAQADPPQAITEMSYEQTAWRYGYGEFDEATQRVAGFQELPWFVDGAWQGGASWPDPALGWVRLTATGGHAGNDLKHAAIRRWIAPRDAMVNITGTVKHEHAVSDGVRFRIVSSRHGLIAQWQLRNQTANASVGAIEVKAGDTLDFIVDLRQELNSDMFNWAPVIQATGGEGVRRWSAADEFAGPASVPLNAWEQYAQVLLLSNEFLFVD